MRPVRSLVAAALLIGMSACAHAPDVPAGPPDYAPIAGEPAPANARYYADCLGQAAATGAYRRAADGGGDELILFTCTGAPARGSRRCSSQATRPAHAIEPAAGSERPATRRSSVVLPTPLRPTSPVRSRPKVRLRSENRVWPSGVRAATRSSVTSADADGLRTWLGEDMDEREQRNGKGETNSQCADHVRRASSELTRNDRMGVKVRLRKHFRRTERLTKPLPAAPETGAATPRTLAGAARAS